MDIITGRAPRVEFVYEHCREQPSQAYLCLCVLPMISCRQLQKLTRFADCGPAAIRDLASEDLSGHARLRKRSGMVPHM